MNKKNNIIKNLLYLFIPILFIIVCYILYNVPVKPSYSYSDIVGYFRDQKVVEYDMNLGTGAMTIKLDDGKTEINYKAPSVSLLYDDIKDYIEEYNKNHADAPMKYDLIRPANTAWLTNLLPLLFGLIIMGAIWYFLFKKMPTGMGDIGKQMGFGNSKLKNMAEEGRKSTFADVAGADEEKEELTEIIEFLKNPQKYNELGARIPKGVILIGPPGTGKTLLARAVAGEAGVPFFLTSGAEFEEVYVGLGASRVRDLFDKAKKNAPCIIFIDEIDAVGRRRGTGIDGRGGVKEQTLNQLLVEMDGFGTNEGVIIMAATNCPDVLDPALVRPGRFDRQVVVGYPDVKGREEILKVHARGKPLAPDVKLKTIAKTTAGFTGADLENLINEAALLAARKDLKAITMEQIEEATMKVIVGTEKKSRVMSDREKKITAYHEAGHAIVTYYCETQDPVHQISIIPRGLAGGYTMSLPKEDRSYRSKKEMEEDVVVLLGGRVSESLFLDDISTGASNDIDRATSIAHAMVTKYGMTDKLGPISYSDNDIFVGMETGRMKNYSEKIASDIDDEVTDIIKSAYAKAENILKDHSVQLENVAKFLFSNEKMSGEQFDDIIKGKEPRSFDDDEEDQDDSSEQQDQ